MIRILFPLFILSLGIYQVTCLMCHSCTLDGELESCEDSINETYVVKIEEKECKPAQSCGKVSFTANGTVRIGRGCIRSSSSWKIDCRILAKEVRDEGIAVTHCSLCDTDLCNE
uniref:10 kDa salivary protein n=1 Tax=Phlebotomus ariasi TaxID=59272 RepID=Q2TJC6_9DIPT|nr:10 kDa salivary protein [Phlebotomus ariasi]